MTSPQEPVQRITSARAPHTQDVSGRMRRYAFSMAIRTACVAGFIIAFPHWSAWLFLPGAVVLPYVSVILANAGRERSPGATAPVPYQSDARAIGTGSRPGA